MRKLPFWRFWPQCRPNRSCCPRPSEGAREDLRGRDEGPTPTPRYLSMVNQPAGSPAIPVGQVEKGVHILPPSTPDSCRKARNKALGQLSEAESPPLNAAAKGINPSFCEAVSLACSTGKQVAMYVRLHGLPKLGRQKSRSSPGELPPNQPSRPVDPAVK